MKIQQLIRTASIITLSSAFVLGCGNKKGGDDADAEELNEATEEAPFSQDTTVSLSTLPDLSDMIAENDDGASLLEVQGTPMKLVDMPSAVDTVFYNGAIAAITEAQSATEDQRQDMERGDAVCRLTSRNAEVFASLSGGTLCYMSQLSKMDGLGFEKESETITESDYSTIFSQEEDTKLVQVKLTQEGQVGMIANLRIIGSNDSPDAYKLEFNMCERDDNGDLRPRSNEEFEINMVDGTYERSEQYSESREDRSYSGTKSIKAFLKEVGGKIKFDLSKDRTINRVSTHSETRDGNTWTGGGKQNIVLNSENEIVTMANFTGSDQHGEGSEKIWAISKIGGSGDDVTMPEGGMKMERSWTNTQDENSDQHTFSAGGAVEWQNTAYADTKESSFFSMQDEYSFDGEDFYGDIDAPTVDIDFDCSTEGDIIVTWDMESDSFDEIDSQCGGNDETGLRAAEEMCYTDEVRQAFDLMWNNQE